MRLGKECIKALQDLLKDESGVFFTAEEAQQAGLAIVRFIIAKQQRHLKQEEERSDEKPKLDN